MTIFTGRFGHSSARAAVAARERAAIADTPPKPNSLREITLIILSTHGRQRAARIFAEGIQLRKLREVAPLCLELNWNFTAARNCLLTSADSSAWHFESCRAADPGVSDACYGGFSPGGFVGGISRQPRA